MKKMLRIAAALAALLAMTNFIGCKNDDDDESGNGLENTYWVMGDISTDVVENVSLTLKKGMYVHIEDSSKGSVYEADVENLDYSTLDFTKTNSVDISYSSEKQPFTYVVDGSKITVTSKYTDEDGKEQTTTFEATLAADKKSFTTKYTDDDGKEVSETYTRIDKAPAKATLVITVTGGSTGGETGTTTGFENTYWVCEDVSYENSGVKITLKNAQYIHIGDSTSGSAYIANVEDYLKGDVVAGTHSVSYPDKGVEFTYTVEGSKVTIKMGEETVSAVIVDENSFSILQMSSTAETHTYTKVAAAPTEATVTVEVTAAPSTKTATIAYDGSSAENAPVATGEEGVFSDVQDIVAGAGVAEGYSLDAGYPKYGSQTYTGDDGVKNGTTSAGMLIVSNLQDGTTKVDFAANAVMAYVTYNFTLSAKSDVEAVVKAFNTQSSALAGKIEILDSNGILKVSKQAEAGSKSANDVTADPVELDAGVYTFKFSWVTTKATQLKKVNCGISSFSIKATTK